MLTFKDYGHEPLPVNFESGQSPVDNPRFYKQYPLILISVERAREYLHIEQRAVNVSRNSDSEPLAEINPATATQYGLLDGTMVKIETKNGNIQIRLKTNSKLATGVVSIPNGCANDKVNNLVDMDVFDPITAYPDFNQLLCSVVPA